MLKELIMEQENLVTQLLEEIKMLKIEIEELKDRDFLLRCLEAHGVDNWDGWDDAMEMYRAGVEDEE